MACLLTSVFAAVIKTAASVGAFEGPGPLLDGGRCVRRGMTLPAVLRLLAISTHDVLVDLATVAACRHTNIAGSTRSFVARPRAAVLSASHELTTYFSTAPAVLVVCVHAASSDGLAATEAVLSRAHQRARRAGASMTSHATGMWALLGQDSWSRAGLPARERWQTCDGFRIQFLLTPA
jgi:hypothetical protein